jgi:hypothetical protein
MATIHKATLGGNGAVIKSAILTEAQAIAERQSGADIVVCGPDLAANRDLAKKIEQSANGTWVLHPPHFGAGLDALPHYQPDPRPPDGHSFYETPHRKAK